MLTADWSVGNMNPDVMSLNVSLSPKKKEKKRYNKRLILIRLVLQ